jgi:nitrite reductase/ring-hydroxylating ferredoxin subunit
MADDTLDNLNSNSSPRRGFLGAISSTIMAGGLMAGYGTFASYAGRFLFPNGKHANGWQFVSTLDALKSGQSLPFVTPAGAKIVIARQSDGDAVENFIALSSVCPHLGCAVHWESQNDRFFCPCHNGAFDASGKATEGPPATAKQELTRFPLKVENGLLYIEVPMKSLGNQQEA